MRIFKNATVSSCSSENGGFSESDDCKRPSQSITPCPKAQHLCHKDSTRLSVMSTVLDASLVVVKY